MGNLTGDRLVEILATLASPHRLRVLAALTGGRSYVSQLARDLGISRALLQVHLKKLERAGLVTAHLELSDDGKALKYYEVTPFSLQLTPDVVAAAAATLSNAGDGDSPPKGTS
ncbi:MULTISPECIES: helix-turn-helix domain-containing protein [unclassified Micromonospora]|uniref:ArsR/SmtB family transcription factor n=1 Tax=unclassified Micromonospora TaxID=2617518 RepID=UPI001C5F8EC3|nr:helix-turn-helix domain-containing protein [Micromonospora sp. RL09-050-HVF-A]MBW4703967.1 winged helix-turn-helix transcriptional regulator [Micromonospora sp. RL09-050-HVF-A]